MSNEWYENKELPPAGTECEVFNSELVASAAWEKCTILFMGKFRCVYNSESCKERIGNVDIIGKVKFRPIKSDREKAIEAAFKMYKEFNEPNKINPAAIGFLFGDMYDAGLLRFPEEK